MHWYTLIIREGKCGGAFHTHVTVGPSSVTTPLLPKGLRKRKRKNTLRNKQKKLQIPWSKAEFRGKGPLTDRLTVLHWVRRSTAYQFRNYCSICHVVRFPSMHSASFLINACGHSPGVWTLPRGCRCWTPPCSSPWCLCPGCWIYVTWTWRKDGKKTSTIR